MSKRSAMSALSILKSLVYSPKEYILNCRSILSMSAQNDTLNFTFMESNVANLGKVASALERMEINT